jgi:multiple sugar transport system permease protein
MTKGRPLPPISPGNIGIYAIIFIGGVLMILPLYFMLIFATQSRETIFNFPPPLLPGTFEQVISNYNALMEMSKGLFWRVFWNSFYLSSVATITTLFFSSLAGYGFAMYEFKGKNWLFNVVIATQAIPNSLNLIPFYLVMNLIGWINQPKALWFPGIASAFGIFLTRQYIQSAIPRELMDAARVDGSTEFGIFWRIVLPLIRRCLERIRAAKPDLSQ